MGIEDSILAIEIGLRKSVLGITLNNHRTNRYSRHGTLVLLVGGNLSIEYSTTCLFNCTCLCVYQDLFGMAADVVWTIAYMMDARLL